MLKKELFNKAMRPELREISDGLNYFLVFLLFFLIIVSVVVVIYFAKWLTLGPKVKKRWNRILGRENKNEHEHGVRVKGGQVEIQADYEEELKKKIEESESPQEKLSHQTKLDSHLKQKERAEREIREAEAAKLAKIEAKEERARVQKEAKEEIKKQKEALKKEKESKKE